jgi:hypothetical protein
VVGVVGGCGRVVGWGSGCVGVGWQGEGGWCGVCGVGCVVWLGGGGGVR